jgi:hypothetical protein
LNIIVGVLYCITIIGAIVGWLPLWIGVLLNRVSSNLEMATQTGSGAAVREANSNLATLFVIVGVLTLIGIVVNVLYVVGVVVFMFASTLG